MNRICLLKDLQVHIAANGTLDTYQCDSNGDGTVPIKSDVPETKQYCEIICTNCGEAFDNSESFTAREHLGKYHEVIDPWAGR